ncbi:lipoate--protein ligase family protein [Pedosphaera parvula]|uniref:Biotin/lipoate A/B protein ligase n=1 Tax=Pedosphaera parvula (strain Ellin514) TaxID=320771 RepID=B9XMW6_PEDPL|nr:lipoate--protein ligase family protein [Pedosphaera parvula]EEF58762.1 biotin/lipoate A/B protein ligase [Pedosphaera parvula Ellin514]
MKYLDLTLPTPAENLACEEALLDYCEQGREEELLRFWEPRQHFVVLGYANKAATEVNLKACETNLVPVLRRCSGGGTVLQGPGCLNYSLVLRIQRGSALATISDTNTYIMKQQLKALQPLLSTSSSVQGHTDLAINNVKFSGNAQRRKRHFLIFHGTILLNFDLPLIENLLAMPSKQPDYRQNRRHSDFLTNLNLPVETVKHAIQRTWAVTEPLTDWPQEQTADLVLNKYSTDEWNLRF